MTRFVFPDPAPSNITSTAAVRLTRIEAIIVLRQATKQHLRWAVLAIDHNFPKSIQEDISCIALGDLIHQWWDERSDIRNR